VEDGPTETDIVLALALVNEKAGPSTIWAAKGSGLYRSRDHGESWASAYDSLALDEPLATTAVVTVHDRDAHATLFAGVPGAVMTSEDGGDAWHIALLGSPPPVVSALAVSANYRDDGTVLAGTLEDGILRSTDRGWTWVPSNFGLLDVGVLTLAMSPVFASDETVYAGTETGIYVSTNGGRAWRDVESADDLGSIESLAISPRFGDDETIFAATESHGVWRSADRGQTWIACGFERRDVAVNQIALDPNFGTRPCIVLLTAGDLQWSDDGGDTWTSIHSWTRNEDAITVLQVVDWSANPPTIFAGGANGEVRWMG
jgi:photosystem II stability/assembly factor-like uncharacterized protein